MKRIVFAGGCFWGVEAYFARISGVKDTCVGYANGRTEAPTYNEVCSGNTGYAEACMIDYDDTYISLKELLEAYWKIIDPTQFNRQGHDVGSQYRTGIFYCNKDENEIITRSLEAEQLKYSKRILTEIEPLINFYPAEEYHQKYLDKNPGGYCHIPQELINK